MANHHPQPKAAYHQPPLPGTSITGKAADLHRQIKETRALTPLFAWQKHSTSLLIIWFLVFIQKMTGAGQR